MKRKTLSLLAITLAGCALMSSPKTGLTGGTFPPCPKAPHCVSSMSTDPAHSVEALSLEGDAARVREKILKTLETMPRCKVLQAEPRYIHAEFSTRIMRFKDDFEIYIDETAKKIHFKSASRIGYYDFNVNRNRVDEFKRHYKAADA